MGSRLQSSHDFRYFHVLLCLVVVMRILIHSWPLRLSTKVHCRWGPHVVSFLGSEMVRIQHALRLSCNWLQVIFYIKPALECVSRKASGCNVKDLLGIRIPSTETSIIPFAFEGCLCLLRLVIPKSVTQIGSGAFACCSSLTSLTIPESANITMGEDAFRDCSSLRSLTIPKSVTQIGYGAFDGCSSLMTIPESANIKYKYYIINY